MQCRRKGSPRCHQHQASADKAINAPVVESRSVAGPSASSVAALIAATRPGLKALASMPKYDTAALISATEPALKALASMPKFDKAALMTVMKPTLERLPSISASLTLPDVKALVTAFSSIDGASLVAAAVPMPKIQSPVSPPVDVWSDALAAVNAAVLDGVLRNEPFPAEILPVGLDVNEFIEATPLELAATAVVISAQTADTPGGDAGAAVDVIGAIPLVILLWVAYLSAPELQAMVDFIDFPLFIAPFALWALRGSKEG